MVNAFIGGEAAETLHEGLYEALHAESLARRLEQLQDYQANFEQIDAAEATEILSRHIGEAARNALEQRSPRTGWHLPTSCWKASGQKTRSRTAHSSFSRFMHRRNCGAETFVVRLPPLSIRPC